MNFDLPRVWSPATVGIPLGANEVHVWRARLDLETLVLDRHSPVLSAEERERAVRFKFSKDRNHFIAARATLRHLLAGYLGEPPEDIQLEILRYGKPTLTADAKIPSLRFNLSHSHGFAMFAFSLGHELGIDLEKIRPEVAFEGIENNLFSPTEKDELAALPLEHRAEGFFLCWTRKEAYVKAHGQGLQISLEGFDVSLTPGEPPALNSTDKERWSLYSISPEAEFAGALVAEGQEHQLRLLELAKRSS